MRYKEIIVIFTISLLLFGMGYISAETSKSKGEATHVTPEVSNEKDTSGLVKVLNYNIEQGGADPNWTKVIEKENPDIILLVESGSFKIKDGSFDRLVKELSDLFPDETPYQGVTFEPDGLTDGQAVISRYPIVDSYVLDVLTLDDGSKYNINHPIIDATVDILGTEVHILVNHLTCCNNIAARLIEQEGIINYIDSLGEVPIMYGGDFNSYSPEDVGDLAPFQYDTTTSLGTEPIEMLINNSHPKAPIYSTFIDTYRTLNPDKKGYTLNSEYEYFNIDHFRSRIDYIFVNQFLVDMLVNSTVVNDYYEALTASDHNPMYTFFNFKADQVDLKPPFAPTGLKANYADSKITLTWNANSEADLYKYSIYRNGCLISDVDASTTQFTDDYLVEDNSIYTYVVTATDTNLNQGVESLPIVVNSSLGQVFAPSGVDLQATTVSGGIEISVTVGDNGGMPVLYYKFYKALNPDDTFVIHEKSTEPTISLSLRTGSSLYFKAVAVNYVGESPLSNYSRGTAGLVSSSPSAQSVSDPLKPVVSKQFEGTTCPTPKNIIEPHEDNPTTTSSTTTPQSTSTPTQTQDASFIFYSVLFGIMIVPVIIKRRK